MPRLPKNKPKKPIKKPRLQNIIFLSCVYICMKDGTYMKDEGIVTWYLTIFRKFIIMKMKIGILLYIKKVCNKIHKNPIKN